jgi:hypothetical protein
MGVLTLPLNGVYFDQIAAGTKAEEYRLVTPHWHVRLWKRDYDAVVLTRGYPKGGGIEGKTRLTRQWRGCERKTITHPHFGPEPVQVFAIDVSRPTTPSQDQSS